MRPSFPQPKLPDTPLHTHLDIKLYAHILVKLYAVVVMWLYRYIPICSNTLGENIS